jgi:hypothetical protein
MLIEQQSKFYVHTLESVSPDNINKRGLYSFWVLRGIFQQLLLMSTAAPTLCLFSERFFSLPYHRVAMPSVVWHERNTLCYALYFAYIRVLWRTHIYTHDILFCSAFFRFFLALSHSLKVVLLDVGLYFVFHSFLFHFTLDHASNFNQ